MTRIIRDEFTDIKCPVTRWRCRQKAKKLCLNCPELAIPGRVRCQKHLDYNKASVVINRKKSDTQVTE